MVRDLPERLRELRAEHHYTQVQVADRVGVTKAMISNYERGERTPQIITLMRLADCYQVSMDYLVGRTSAKNWNLLVEKRSEPELVWLLRTMQTEMADALALAEKQTGSGKKSSR